MIKTLSVILALFLGLSQADAWQRTSDPLLNGWDEVQQMEAPSQYKESGARSCQPVPSADESQPTDGNLGLNAFVRPDAIIIGHSESPHYKKSRDQVSISGYYVNPDCQRIQFDENILGNWPRRDANLYVEQFLEVRKQALSSRKYLKRINESVFEISDVDF